ncbi:phage head closure protein [Hoeflea sp. YIM 152468]|uniref:phage head closure protein n=1 Tax=Hoeflea sp. YIM 152468 TaxID=3031759 RepID=UPI0023DBCB71|nr:phage head closure protein [Hoeflea sp. YIM 152468]MDF1606958.1 phage head closure protein [Hoeflea sp. YIM 152468]
MAGAGKLDRRIVIERATVTYNALNEPVKTWAAYARIWAARKDVSDGEKLAGGQVGASLSSRFTVRSSSESRAIKPSDRVNHDGGIWSIFGIKETADGRRRYLEITVARDLD